MTTAATPARHEDRRAAVAPAPLLEIRDLTVTFDNPGGPRILAVDGARMTVHAGQTLAVVGESGCGKSITALSILGLVPRPPGRFDAGSVLLRDRDSGSTRDLLALDERSLRVVRGGDIAMIFQEPMTSLNPVFTVGEQLVEAVRLHQRAGKREALEIAVASLEAVGIRDASARIRAYPHEFSGGMRQRVMIAMALACTPRVLLADEPTTALDVTVQGQILDLIASLRKDRGLGVMLITHDLGIVAERADVVCVMYAGRVVEYARVRELFARPMHPYTRALLACVPRLRDRRERLATIKESIGTRPRFDHAPARVLELDPWWPWDKPPAGVVQRTGPARDSALVEAEPGHWVCAWRTERAAQAESPRPDLPPDDPR